MLFFFFTEKGKSLQSVSLASPSGSQWASLMKYVEELEKQVTALGGDVNIEGGKAVFFQSHAPSFAEQKASIVIESVLILIRGYLIENKVASNPFPVSAMDNDFINIIERLLSLKPPNWEHIPVPPDPIIEQYSRPSGDAVAHILANVFQAFGTREGWKLWHDLPLETLLNLIYEVQQSKMLNSPGLREELAPEKQLERSLYSEFDAVKQLKRNGATADDLLEELNDITL